MAGRSVRLPLHAASWRRRSLRGLAFAYLALMLVIPLGVIFQDGLRAGVSGLWAAVTQPVAWAALLLTLRTAAIMVVINTIMGTLTAYVLVRYEFAGKSILNALVDLPLAIPTLVTGVMLVILYGPQQPLGGWLERALGWRIIFAPPGIVLALLFVTFPFVVRAVQPVLLSLDRAVEDAAATLGAGSWTIFRRVTLPPLLLPLTSGALLSFARAIGEFGAIIIVAGNIPLRSQTAAVYVWGEVESENRFGASAVSVALLAIAFTLIVVVDWLQSRRQRGTV
ncbi:MAG: sulfate ABC transporter permease subunit CysT [Anaerolineae bacterium]